MMNYFRVGIPLLTGLNEMLNVNQERKYIEPLLVSKRHSSTFYIAGNAVAQSTKISSISESAGLTLTDK